jgi:hypothetical protein
MDIHERINTKLLQDLEKTQEEWRMLNDDQFAALTDELKYAAEYFSRLSRVYRKETGTSFVLKLG